MIYKISFRAMGSQMMAALEGSPQVKETLEQVPGWFEAWEQSLSRFRPDSELNQLNRAAGRTFHASQTLVEVVKYSLIAASESGGMVTPAVLDALELAGYDKSFDLLTPVAGPSWMDTIAIDSPDGIELAEDAGTIRLPAGMRLDLGGVAKGWAAQYALQRLEKFGSALVDCGGDVAVGNAPDESYGSWPVGIADPIHDGENIEILNLKCCGVATSGQDYRRWLKGGIWQHHLIDPRTGRPAMTDVLTATVVAPTVIQAEMAAKTVLILGSYAGMDWLERQPGMSGLLVLQDESMVRFGEESRKERNLAWLKA